MAFSYTLSIVTIALSQTILSQFAIECRRCSNQQGVGHFGAKFEEEVLTDVNSTIWQRHAAVVCKKSVLISSAV